MNDMHETLAEIRRRGNERIRARKQLRNRITALCVPLVLCAATVLTAPVLEHSSAETRPQETVIPAETIQSTTKPMNQEALHEIKEDSDMILKSKTLKVQGKDLERSYTDEETISAFRKLLSGWDSTQWYTSHYSEDETRAGSPAMEVASSGGIRLILTDGDETWIYILYPRSFYDTQEKVGYPITHAQYTAMMELLKLELP